MKINWDNLTEHKMVEGLYGRFEHTKGMTIARWRFEKGAELPVHSHIHEQITIIQSGSLELMVGEEKVILGSGDLLTIESDVPHGGRALEDTIALDIFTPVREDFVEKFG